MSFPAPCLVDSPNDLRVWPADTTVYSNSAKRGNLPPIEASEMSIGGPTTTRVSCSDDSFRLRSQIDPVSDRELNVSSLEIVRSEIEFGCLLEV